MLYSIVRTTLDKPYINLKVTVEYFEYHNENMKSQLSGTKLMPFLS
jgi:hypothetical protein